MEEMKKSIYEKLYKESRVKFKTQGEFADALGISKQSLNSTIRKLETNGNIAIDNFLKMCEVLNLDVILQEKK